MNRAALATVLILLTTSGVAHSSPSEAPVTQPVLVLGVSGLEELANDPNNTRSIAEFTQNFAKVVTLTHRRDGAPALLDLKDKAADLALSVKEDLSGKLSTHSREALAPLREIRQDTLIAHSWGAMALMYAIRDNEIPPPKLLVIINPPLLSPEGTRQWRTLAERFPELALDVWIGTDDLLNRGRKMASRPQKNEETGEFKLYSPADALMPFLTPNAPAKVRVRMYPGDHRLLGFLDFASRKNEYGLKPRAVGGSVEFSGPAMPAFLNDVFRINGGAGHGKPEPRTRSGYAYLFETGPGLARAQVFARAAGIDRMPQTRELLQARAERSVQERAQARWEYAALLIATACSTPYVLREHEMRGLLPGLRMPLSDLRLGYERGRRSMSACELEILEEIIANSKSMTIRDLADHGERYRYQHNPARVAGRAIGQLFSSIGRALAAPIEKIVDALETSSLDSSGSERSSGSQWTRSSGSERESPPFEFQSPAFDQLKTGNYSW